MKKIIRKLLAFAVVLSLTMSGCISSGNSEDNDKNGKNGTEQNTTNNSSDYISSLPQEVQKQITRYDDGDFVFVPPEDNLKYDEEAYTRYYNNIVTAFTYDDLSSSEMKELADSINGVVVGDISGNINYLQFLVDETSFETINSYANTLTASDKVMYASYDVPMEITFDSVDNNPWNNDGRTIDDKGREDDPNGNDWWAEAIGAYTAWNYSDYTHPVNVGIIDSGFHLNHEDLSGKIHMLEPDYISQTEDLHGTHVAGIIGAKNNNVGIRGIADHSEIYGVDFTPYTDNKQDTNYHVFSTGESISATEQMIDRNILVINNSYGQNIYSESAFNNQPNLVTQYINYQNYCRCRENESYHQGKQYLMKIISLMMNHQDSFLIVFSAGNGLIDENDHHIGIGTNAIFGGYTKDISEEMYNRLPEEFRTKLQTQYKIDYHQISSHFINVGAASRNTDSNGNYYMTSFSNYGHTVDICAPGENIYSTVIPYDDGSNHLCSYKNESGTSMSAPMVSGAAAMIWSLNPDYTAEEVKDLLISSSTKRAVPVGSGAASELPTDYPFLNVGAAAQKAHQEYRLRHYLEVSGRVTDQNDQALPDVTVTLKAGNVGYESRTDEYGKYFFDIEKQGVDYTLEFSKQSYLTLSKDFYNETVRQLTFDEKLFLLSDSRNFAGVLSGQVFSESHQPLKNAYIRVYTADDQTAIRFGEDERYTADDGKFALPMPEGEYLLVITCKGYDPVNITVTIEKNRTTCLDSIILKTANSSSMSGNIVKADNVYYYLGYDDQSNLNLYQGGSDMKDAVKADSVISFSDLSIYGENDFADLYVYGSKIYYNKIKDFYCYDTASGKVSKVQTGRLLDLCDDFLVYSVDSGQEFYKYNLRTNAAQLIKKFNAPFAEYKGFFDDKIFLCSEPGANLTFDRISLYYFDSDNKEHTIDLHDVSERIKGSGSSESMGLGNFVHYKNRIYFIAAKLSAGSGTFAADAYLVSMNPDGSDIKYTHIENKNNISYTSQIDYISNNEVYIANGKINIDSGRITYTGKSVRYSSSENVLYTENDSWYLANNDFSDPRKITDEKTYKKSVSGAESIYGISYGILDHYLLMNIGCKTFQNAGWKGKTIKYVHSVFDLNTLDNYEENFIQAIIDNESEWRKDNGSLYLEDMYFFDIDFDNKLEFLVKYGDNYHRIYITEVYYYENGLKKYRSPINDGMSRFEVFLDTKSQKHILRGKNYSGTMMGAGGTHYFDIEISREFSKSTLYAYSSWSRNPSPPYDITFAYYKYDNVTYTTLEEAFNLAAEITEDEYKKIEIEKSENLVPVYVYSDEIEIQKYNKCSYAQKKDLLENAYNSVEYQEHSDQIQYYNGKHYYTPSLTVLGGGSGSYDFSQVGADYAALLELNIMHDEYQRVKIDNFIIVNDVIYFTNKYMKNGPGTDTADLYKCDMNGGSVTKIAESVYDNFHYMNGNIYFKTNNNQFDGTEDKEQCYSISTGKITDADFSFASYNRQSRFSPFSVTDSSIKYYCGGMYYQMPNDDEEVIRTEKANMFIHRVDKNGKDVIVGKWMSQIR